MVSAVLLNNEVIDFLAYGFFSERSDMQSHIFDRDELLTPEAKETVLRRLQYATSRFEGVLSQVDLRVSDENGPRGGIDKAVRLTAKPKQGEEIVINDVDEDILAAVSRAAERLGRTLARQVDRQRNRRQESSKSSNA